MSRHDIYPRAVPHRAPGAEAPTATTPQGGTTLRRLAGMAGVCGVFLAVGLGLGGILMGRGRADPPSERDRRTPAANELHDSLVLAGNREAPRELPRPAPPVPPAQELVAPAGALKELPRPATPPASGLPGNGGKVTSQPGKPTSVPEVVVEALGGLTASHLYQTYLNIGLLADSVEGELYNKEEAGKLLDTVSGLMTGIEQQLDRVGRQALTAEETKAVEQAQQIMGKLRTQSRELKSYWTSNNKDHVARFHQARQDAWDGIKALLNITE